MSHIIQLTLIYNSQLSFPRTKMLLFDFVLNAMHKINDIIKALHINTISITLFTSINNYYFPFFNSSNQHRATRKCSLLIPFLQLVDIIHEKLQMSKTIFPIFEYLIFFLHFYSHCNIQEIFSQIIVSSFNYFLYFQSTFFIIYFMIII